MLKVAVPPLIVAVPRVVPPFLKVTVPVAAVELTIAVNVIDVFELDGLADGVSVIVVLALFTVSVILLLVLPLSFVSPP